MTEITNEQRRAYESLSDPKRLFTASEIGVLAPLLPSELTNPQPALPTEPGRYADKWRDEGWLFHASGNWSLDGEPVDEVFARSCAPFARLVPERPEITLEQITEAWTFPGPYASNTDRLRRILALVNGSDQ